MKDITIVLDANFFWSMSYDHKTTFSWSENDLMFSSITNVEDIQKLLLPNNEYPSLHAFKVLYNANHILQDIYNVINLQFS